MKAVSFKPDVFHKWCQLGLEQGLKTDTEIADFLLQQFQSSRDVKRIQGYTCIFCSTTLPSVCAQCGTLAKSHELATVDAKHITAVTVTTSDLVMDTGQVTATAALNSFTAADQSNSLRTVQIAKQECDLQLVKKEIISEIYPSDPVSPNEEQHVTRGEASGHTQQQLNGFQVSGRGSKSLKKRVDKFQCEVCAENFSGVTSLSRHRHRCHSDTKKAETGSAVTTPTKQRSDEESVPSGDEDLPVQFMDTFEYSQPLTEKQKDHQRSGTTKLGKCLCQVCGGVYASKASLRLHMRTHAGVKPYVCPQCNHAFRYSGHLTRHRRVHSGERPYLCTQCGATFTQKNDLKRHIHRHTGLKPFVCNECGKWFSTAGDLRMHVVTHSKELPYKCQECGASFARKSRRVKHMRTHTGEKPYQCCDCGLAYADSSTLRRHRQKNHQEMASKTVITAEIPTDI